MALFAQIKSAGQMDPDEIQNAEERYQLYMNGQKKRIPGLHITMDFGKQYDAMIMLIKKMQNQRVVIDAGGILSGRTAMVHHFMNGSNIEYKSISREDLYTKPKFPIGFHLSDIGLGEIFINEAEKLSKANSKIQMARWNEEIEIGKSLDYDEPENFFYTNPPKQKKYRSFIVDKRAINRRNRKSKRK